MKIKFKRNRDGSYSSQLNKKKGGLGTFLAARNGTFWFCLQIFTLKNIIKALTLTPTT